MSAPELSGEDSRTYVVGLPVVVTIAADGGVTFEVDLAEVGDIDEQAPEEYDEATVAADVIAATEAAQRISNFHIFNA